MDHSELPISVAPEVGPGHLCLVGAGEYLEPMAPVDRELLRLTPAARAGRMSRVVCLPTAAGTEGERVVGRWMQMGERHFSALGADAEGLRIVDRAGADDAGMASVISGADLVYLSGGKPPYLLDALRGSRAWTAMLAMLGRGGVLAGCSAGAMIMGSWIPNWPALTSRRSAFGLVPNALVLPHFDEMFGRLAGMTQLRRPEGSFLLGIDGMTGLLAGADGWRVLGARRVVVDDGETSTELRANRHDLRR
jgi:cyanophycinase-like exopeptidase